MELKIYTHEDSFPQNIDWNYEELKAELADIVKDYESCIYSDDSIKIAKADRAKLNKFIGAINGERTKIRKLLLAPDEKFGQEVKMLTGMVERAITNIDSQIKGCEERQREEKTAKVREIYEDNIADLAEFLPFEKVFKPQYANSGTTLKSIKADITNLIQRVAEGLAIINEMDTPYAGDMKAVFLKTYDLSATLDERNRLEAAEQRRKEYEAQREAEKAERKAAMKAEAAKMANAGKPLITGSENPVRSQKAEITSDVFHLDFRVYVTNAQMELLKQFLKENNIQYGRVPKGA